MKALIAVDQDGRHFLIDATVYRLSYCCVFCRRVRRNYQLAMRCAEACFVRRRLSPDKAGT